MLSKLPQKALLLLRYRLMPVPQCLLACHLRAASNVPCCHTQHSGSIAEVSWAVRLKAFIACY